MHAATNLLQATVLCEKTAANSSKYGIPQRALISPHTFTSIQDGSGFSICDWPGDMPEMRKRHSVGSILSSPWSGEDKTGARTLLGGG